MKLPRKTKKNYVRIIHISASKNSPKIILFLTKNNKIDTKKNVMGKKNEKIRNTYIKSKVILSLKKEPYTSIIIDNLKQKNEMKEILYNISIKSPIICFKLLPKFTHLSNNWYDYR